MVFSVSVQVKIQTVSDTLNLKRLSAFSRVSIRLYIHNTREAAASALHCQDFFYLETPEQLWPLVYSQGACIWNGEYLIPV